MADWVPISEGDVSGSDFTAAEVAMLRALQGTDTEQAAVALTEKIEQVVAEFRQAILDQGTSVAAGETIPAGYKGHAVALARWRWLTSFPQLTRFQTRAREEAAKRAEELIDAIGTGKRTVTPPETPNTETPGGLPSPSFGTKCRKFTNETMNGS